MLPRDVDIAFSALAILVFGVVLLSPLIFHVRRLHSRRRERNKAS